MARDSKAWEQLHKIHGHHYDETVLGTVRRMLSADLKVLWEYMEKEVRLYTLVP